jgi:hypothetical protein
METQLQSFLGQGYQLIVNSHEETASVFRERFFGAAQHPKMKLNLEDSRLPIQNANSTPSSQVRRTAQPQAPPAKASG